jgi:hypothetical protein
MTYTNLQLAVIAISCLFGGFALGFLVATIGWIFRNGR